MRKKIILVVREFDNFSRILCENDFEIINCQTIKTYVLEDLSDFENKLENINCFNGIFLTSRKATEIFRDESRERNINFHGKIYILGKRSFDLLKDENFDLFFDENANTARELLETIHIEDLKDKRFLFVRGEKSLRVVPEFLENIAKIDEIIVYRTEKFAIEIDKIKFINQKFETGDIDAACFFSPSAAESFLEQFGTEIFRKFHQTKIASIGRTTAEFFERRGLKADFVSGKTAAEDFAVGLIQFLERNLTTDLHG